MRRRPGFTIVELLVSMALIVFILLILAEAFQAGTASFRQLKAIGDMQERLRSATMVLRRDLSADHFEGRRRLSDSADVWNFQGKPREGFFRLVGATAGQDEGADADSIPSRRRTNPVLHFTVKLRGNQRSDFLSIDVPASSRLVTTPTDFFSQPTDGRYQSTPATTYNTQWAEVAYFLRPLQDAAGNPVRAGTTPLYALYRTQLLVVPDSRALTNLGRPASEVTQYPDVSCQADGSQLRFNNPNTLVSATDPATGRPRRAFNPANPTQRGTPVLVLTDVISFDVQASRELLVPTTPPFGPATPGTGTTSLVITDFQDATFDTGDGNGRGDPVVALQITLRVWDLKTQQTRQITIIQDM
jgi:type II secretory pathway pseudopilin PulG